MGCEGVSWVMTVVVTEESVKSALFSPPLPTASSFISTESGASF